MGRYERGRGRRFDSRGGRALQGQERTTSEALSALREAEVLQQRAERRKGAQASALFLQATEKLEEALQAAGPRALPVQHRQSAYFDLGDALQGGADAVLQASREAPEEHLAAAEQAAEASARLLLERAAQANQQVRDPDGSVRVDACMNCGNTFASWAELEPPGRATELLQQAESAYKAALLKEEDAMTYSNLADAYVSMAERLASGGDAQNSQRAYEEAMAAYERACSLSSSENGDDLPGLLHNWGVGLFSAGTHLQDPSAAAGALEEAARKLQASIDFDRADVAPLTALGDVLVARAERAQYPSEGTALLHAALKEGYTAALQINSRHADALVGVAETELQLGRGDAGRSAMSHFQVSVDAYARSLADPQALGTFRDRSDVRYNYACASFLAGSHLVAEQTLRSLLAVGGTTREDIINDPDFHAARDQEWFQQLCTVPEEET